MDIYTIMRTRRSVRHYRPDPIPQEVLDRVLDAARIAPSGSNRQPTRLIVVTDPKIKEQLVPLCHDQAFIATAPVVVVACGRDLHYNRGEWMGDYAMIVDVSIAVDHLTLAARAEGLGTCWIGSFSNAKLKEFFGLPDDVNVVALTPLGYPEGDPFTDPEGRLPLEEFVMWEGWKG
ncbi:MAG TPA: nitroreductase family protein [Armatimonadota bacterium]|nr:nitroreductase family protein [Armatimonadota bacterium]